MPRIPQALAVILLASLAAACGGGSGEGLPSGSEPVHLDPASFSSTVDNPYWPMRPGTRWVYREVDADGTEQRIDVTVLPRTTRILGIDARVVHDVVTEDGAVVEDTYDWYAQDGDGNVWYLGEDTKELEDGRVTSTAGSWRAGVDGAQPGVLLPGSPAAGLAYRQEYLRGEAEDAAEVMSLHEKVTVPAGSFDDVLMTREWTPLEPSVLEHKFYAPGVGPVLALTIAGTPGREELVRVVRPS